MSAHKESGFTLVELLVSLAVLSLLALVLFEGLSFGVRAWEHDQLASASEDHIGIIQTLLRRSLERSCPRRLAANSGEIPKILFSGTSERMRFLGPEPMSAGGRLCAPLGIVSLTNRHGSQLVLQRLDGNGDIVEQRTLLDHLAFVRFSYLGDRGWRSTWTGQTALPASIRIAASFQRNDLRTWPDLFVSPRISAEADCTYDPVIKGCRGP
ncbi:MAG TPA: prepilin-type N-terminal cleavage/methylation domain-containing protein [Rhizomicrobium sp.]|nr:prepilin-type N-terminal cleavage/methylation domain-containing protein [Rhizomicrobium sp.]